MMANLFSSFDPSTSNWMALNWASAAVAFLLVNKYWTKPSPVKMLMDTVLKSLYKEFKIIVSNNKYFSFVLMALFLFILLNNFMGLFPYIFTATSHMSVTMSLAMPLWIGMMMFGWIKFNKDMFAHMVPQSTPGVLMPFMVLIESVSNVIRPLTLAIRLSANMIAGHLLMTLLGNQAASSSGKEMPAIMLVQLGLISLEMAVSMIQAYVFSILMTLYIGEIGSH